MEEFAAIIEKHGTIVEREEKSITVATVKNVSDLLAELNSIFEVEHIIVSTYMIYVYCRNMYAHVIIQCIKKNIFSESFRYVKQLSIVDFTNDVAQTIINGKTKYLVISPTANLDQINSLLSLLRKVKYIRESTDLAKIALCDCPYIWIKNYNDKLIYIIKLIQMHRCNSINIKYIRSHEKRIAGVSAKHTLYYDENCYFNVNCRFAELEFINVQKLYIRSESSRMPNLSHVLRNLNIRSLKLEGLYCELEDLRNNYTLISYTEINTKRNIALEVAEIMNRNYTLLCNAKSARKV